MRRLLFMLLAAVAFAPTPVRAGPNIPLCIAIKQNLDECARNNARAQRHYYWRREEWEEWGEEGPPPTPPTDCNAWLFELKANHCL